MSPFEGSPGHAILLHQSPGGDYFVQFPGQALQKLDVPASMTPQQVADELPQMIQTLIRRQAQESGR